MRIMRQERCWKSGTGARDGACGPAASSRCGRTTCAWGQSCAGSCCWSCTSESTRAMSKEDGSGARASMSGSARTMRRRSCRRGTASVRIMRYLTKSTLSGIIRSKRRKGREQLKGKDQGGESRAAIDTVLLCECVRGQCERIAPEHDLNCLLFCLYRD